MEDLKQQTKRLSLGTWMAGQVMAGTKPCIWDLGMDQSCARRLNGLGKFNSRAGSRESLPGSHFSRILAGADRAPISDPDRRLKK